MCWLKGALGFQLHVDGQTLIRSALKTVAFALNKALSVPIVFATAALLLPVGSAPFVAFSQW